MGGDSFDVGLEMGMPKHATQRVGCCKATQKLPHRNHDNQNSA